MCDYGVFGTGTGRGDGFMDNLRRLERDQMDRDERWLDEMREESRKTDRERRIARLKAELAELEG